MTQRYVVALASALLFAGCSSSADSTISPPPSSPSGTATLTVANFDGWCTLSVTSPAGTNLPSGASGVSNAVTLPVNTAITLHAEPNSGFIWAVTTARAGGWSGTLDSGTDPLGKSITVTLSASKSVKVCCPFPDGSGCV
jgi:hypothetical protein